MALARVGLQQRGGGGGRRLSGKDWGRGVVGIGTVVIVIVAVVIGRAAHDGGDGLKLRPACCIRGIGGGGAHIAACGDGKEVTGGGGGGTRYGVYATLLEYNIRSILASRSSRTLCGVLVLVVS